MAIFNSVDLFRTAFFLNSSTFLSNRDGKIILMRFNSSYDSRTFSTSAIGINFS